MSNTVEVRLAGDEDADAVAALALKVFQEFVAPLYSPEGPERVECGIRYLPMVFRLTEAGYRV